MLLRPPLRGMSAFCIGSALLLGSIAPAIAQPLAPQAPAAPAAPQAPQTVDPELTELPLEGVSASAASAGSTPSSSATPSARPSASASAKSTTTPEATPGASDSESPGPESGQNESGANEAGQADSDQNDPEHADHAHGVEGQVEIAALPARTTKEFNMLGVTWASDSTTPAGIQVRVQQNGAWGEWADLEPEADSAVAQGEGKARPGTAPAYVGDSQGVEVRVYADPAKPAPRDLKVSLIDPKELSSDSDPASVQGGVESAETVASRGGTQALDAPAGQEAAGQEAAQAPMPSYVSRAGWGADESLRSYNGADCAVPNYTQTVQAVVVHHTDGTNNYSRSQSAGIVRGVYAYHTKSNGWCDIGYNFLIDRYGTIFEGRAGGATMPVRGAHAIQWNTNTMGISLMGNFSSSLPPSAALDSAVRLSAWRLAAYYRPAHGRLTISGVTGDRISGHRQVVSTSCPGQAFYNYLPTFRNRVANALGNTNTAIYQRWQSLGGANGALGQPMVGEAPVRNGRVTRFPNHDLYSAPGVRTSYTKGAIAEKYRSMGGPNSFLGFPTTDEVCSNTGCWNGFQGGFILWSYPSGAHVSVGAIRDKYGALGHERGWLGYPTTDEMCNASGCRQDYQGGTIMWSGPTGAKFIRGVVRDRYDALRGANGPLGYPTTDEICGQIGGGCYQEFGPRGAIYYKQSTGAHQTWGAIRDRYNSVGAHRGRLGYPTGGEVCSSPQSCTQQFERGRIDWTFSGGAVIR